MKRSILVGLTLFAAIPALAGTLWYDNGLPDGANGNEMTQWLQTEDFIAPSNGSLVEIDFWAFPYGGNPYDGTVQWWIFADNGGNPGAVKATGIANPAATPWGNTQFGPDYIFKIATPSVALTGGTLYHLGLHMNTTGNYQVRDNWYWESTAYNSTNTGIESMYGTQDNWYNNGVEHSFQLFVPEPVSALGLLSLALLARRR